MFLLQNKTYLISTIIQGYKIIQSLQDLESHEVNICQDFMEK